MADVVSRKEMQRAVRQQWLQKYAANVRRQLLVSDCAGLCATCYASPCLADCPLQYEPRPPAALCGGPRQKLGRPAAPTTTTADPAASGSGGCRINGQPAQLRRQQQLSDCRGFGSRGADAAESVSFASPRVAVRSSPTVAAATRGGGSPPPRAGCGNVGGQPTTARRHSRKRNSGARRRGSRRTSADYDNDDDVNGNDYGQDGDDDGDGCDSGANAAARHFDAILSWLLREKLFLAGGGGGGGSGGCLRTGLGSLVQASGRGQPPRAAAQERATSSGSKSSARRRSTTVWRRFSDYVRAAGCARSAADTMRSPRASRAAAASAARIDRGDGATKVAAQSAGLPRSADDAAAASEAAARSERSRALRLAAEREYYAMAFGRIVIGRRSSAARAASNRRAAQRLLLRNCASRARSRLRDQPSSSPPPLSRRPEAEAPLTAALRGRRMAAATASGLECHGAGRCPACSGESLFYEPRLLAPPPPKPFEEYLLLERQKAASRRCPAFRRDLSCGPSAPEAAHGRRAAGRQQPPRRASPVPSA